LQVKIQNRKTGFTGSQKPVFRFWKNSGLPGFSVSVKTGLETLNTVHQSSCLQESTPSLWHNYGTSCLVCIAPSHLSQYLCQAFTASFFDNCIAPLTDSLLCPRCWPSYTSLLLILLTCLLFYFLQLQRAQEVPKESSLQDHNHAKLSPIPISFETDLAFCEDLILEPLCQ